MPVANIRAAHNVLAVIAHKALLNGDDRQIVHEANTMLFEFINKFDPQEKKPAREVVIPDLDTRLDGLRGKPKAKS